MGQNFRRDSRLEDRVRYQEKMGNYNPTTPYGADPNQTQRYVGELTWLYDPVTGQQINKPDMKRFQL